MLNILILPFHGMGHFNGLFGVVRALLKTHHVVFAGVGYFSNHTVTQGFQYRTLSSYPFGLGLESWIHQVRKSKYSRFRNMTDRWSDKLYHERKKELTNILTELKPVHVLVDAAQATDVIVLKAIDPNLKVSVVNVAPPYMLVPGLPPANSLALPGETKLIDWDHLREIRAIWDKKWRQRVKYFAPDDRAIIQRRLRKNKLLHLKSDYPSLFTFAVKDVDQYVLTYREFDFCDDRFPELKYVGSHVDPTALERLDDEFTRLIDENRAKGKKIVYCSFGTVPPARNIQKFLAKLSEAVSQINCFVIVSTKSAGDFKAVPGRVQVFNWVPQSALLEQCDLFITHGGINSVHDSIRSSVPMLVYPLSTNYDQNGNSSRVVHHGLGLRGHFDADTAHDIRSKMIEIFNDIRFRKNLDALKIKTSNYSTDDFVKLLLS